MTQRRGVGYQLHHCCCYHTFLASIHPALASLLPSPPSHHHQTYLPGFTNSLPRLPLIVAALLTRLLVAIVSLAQEHRPGPGLQTAAP